MVRRWCMSQLGLVAGVLDEWRRLLTFTSKQQALVITESVPTRVHYHGRQWTKLPKTFIINPLINNMLFIHKLDSQWPHVTLLSRDASTPNASKDSVYSVQISLVHYFLNLLYTSTSVNRISSCLRSLVSHVLAWCNGFGSFKATPSPLPAQIHTAALAVQQSYGTSTATSSATYALLQWSAGDVVGQWWSQATKCF